MHCFVSMYLSKRGRFFSDILSLPSKHGMPSVPCIIGALSDVFLFFCFVFPLLNTNLYLEYLFPLVILFTQQQALALTQAGGPAGAIFHSA